MSCDYTCRIIPPPSTSYFLLFVILGSRGGGAVLGGSGGAGGGIFYLNISNTVIVNGDLKSNGMAGPSTGSGGGSGGSILIETKKIVGTGTIQVINCFTFS